MAAAKCSITGCEAAACARGWCKSHYNRWKYSGNPEPTRSPRLTCLRCGDRLPSGRGRGAQAKYCSPRCRTQAAYERQKRRGNGQHRRRKAQQPLTARDCPHCGSTFVPAKTARQIYCSKNCGRRASESKQKAICSDPECESPARALDLCHLHYRRARRQSSSKLQRGNDGRP